MSVREFMLAGMSPTEILTVPFPVPLAPLVIVIQLAEVVAVQPHVGPVMTEMSKLPPCRAKLCDAGLIEKVQPVACVTVNVLPAIVRVPVRSGPELAET